jgi:D-alanyl-lipoteichoic acid acyltransferase DltB (MBOAT superfamily)
MLFNSPTFVVFFVCVFAAYWLLRSRVQQNILLLVASYVFYGAWSWKFLLLLLLTTLVDYTCGRVIHASATARRRRFVMLASVATNLGILATFKYLGFFVQETATLLESIGWRVNLPVLEIVLPVGISFYTFQSIGYVVDVYRGKIPPTRNLIEYALYVAFFPQLVAGPIERSGHLIPQFQRHRQWSRQAFDSGLQLMIWGLFKKIVIADHLAPFVDAVYARPEAYDGSALATATVFFAFQIYCDFSGYTDTARGAARLLGFELVRNFDYPYVSRTPVEFWRRWHMSLSTWFQDYLYFPLAMHYLRKGGWGSKYKAHIVSMGLIGFWHGANWTFISFGLYWGVVIALYLSFTERFAKSSEERVPGRRTAPRFERYAPTSGRWASVRRWSSPASVIGMFVVASLGWVLFRADSMTTAWQILSNLFSAEGLHTVLRPDVPDAPTLWALIGGLLLLEWLYRNRPTLRTALRGGHVTGIAARYALVAAILFSYVITQGGAGQPFIYFQF